MHEIYADKENNLIVARLRGYIDALEAKEIQNEVKRNTSLINPREILILVNLTGFKPKDLHSGMILLGIIKSLKYKRGAVVTDTPSLFGKNSARSNYRAFNNEEDALDYLLKQSR